MSGLYSTGAFIVCELARAEPAHGALAAVTTDADRILEFAPVARVLYQ